MFQLMKLKPLGRKFLPKLRLISSSKGICVRPRNMQRNPTSVTFLQRLKFSLIYCKCGRTFFKTFWM